MPTLATTLRRKARRSFYGAAGVYVASGILLGALFCLSLAFYLAMRETLPPATATALTGLMLLVLSVFVLLLTVALVKFSKHREAEALQAPEGEDIKQALQTFVTGPDNPLVGYVQHNPTQAVLIATALGGVLGASPVARQAVSTMLQELAKKQAADSEHT